MNATVNRIAISVVMGSRLRLRGNDRETQRS